MTYPVKDLPSDTSVSLGMETGDPGTVGHRATFVDGARADVIGIEVHPDPQQPTKYNVAAHNYGATSFTGSVITGTL